MIKRTVSDDKGKEIYWMSSIKILNITIGTAKKMVSIE